MPRRPRLGVDDLSRSGSLLQAGRQLGTDDQEVVLTFAALDACRPHEDLVYLGVIEIDRRRDRHLVADLDFHCSSFVRFRGIRLVRLPNAYR